MSRSAAAQGIRTFRAYVHEDNDAMLRIFRDFGAHVGRADIGVCQLDIPVPEDPETGRGGSYCHAPSYRLRSKLSAVDAPAAT